MTMPYDDEQEDETVYANEHEETLSDKISKYNGHEVLLPKDVKEFIKKLKEDQCVCIDNKELGIKTKCRFCKTVEILAGKELIK